MKNFRKKAIPFIIVTVVVAGAYFVSANWYQFMLIQGNSMQPAYHDLQLVILNKYDRDYKEGDVIAFFCPGLDCVLVKRIERITPEGQYYVLGDNREESVDSRDDRVGLVPGEDIIGKIAGRGAGIGGRW